MHLFFTYLFRITHKQYIPKYLVARIIEIVRRSKVLNSFDFDCGTLDYNEENYQVIVSLSHLWYTLWEQFDAQDKKHTRQHTRYRYVWWEWCGFMISGGSLAYSPFVRRVNRVVLWISGLFVFIYFKVCAPKIKCI